MSKKSFTDIQVGDVVVAVDNYGHDEFEQCIKITSIEFDKEHITETNPQGMVCYGDNLDKEDLGDEYIETVYESNFVDIVEKKQFTVDDLWYAATTGNLFKLKLYYGSDNPKHIKYFKFGKFHSLIMGAYRNENFDCVEYLIGQGELLANEYEAKELLNYINSQKIKIFERMFVLIQYLNTEQWAKEEYTELINKLDVYNRLMRMFA